MPQARSPRRRNLVVAHTSDKVRDADKVRLEVLACVSAGIGVLACLPTGVDHRGGESTEVLVTCGGEVRHRSMSLLRRAYLWPKALLRLVWRCVRALIQPAKVSPDYICASISATPPYPLLEPLVVAVVVVHLHQSIDGTGPSMMTPFQRFAHLVPAVSRTVRDLLADPHWVLLACDRRSWKGGDCFQRAWPRLGRRHLQFVMLGDPPPAGHGTDVMQYVRQLPNAGTMVVLRQAAGVGKTWASRTALIVLSNWRVLAPTIANESNAAGHWLFACDSGRQSWVLRGGTGRLVGSGRVEDRVKALRELGPMECPRIAPKARPRCRAEFDAQRFHSGLRDDFKGVSSERPIDADLLRDGRWTPCRFGAPSPPASGGRRVALTPGGVRSVLWSSPARRITVAVASAGAQSTARIERLCGSQHIDIVQELAAAFV